MARLTAINVQNERQKYTLRPQMKDDSWKKPKGWFESSGCEIQKRVEKGFSFTEYCLPQHSSCAHGSAFGFAIFVGFVCFGLKEVKLYIIAFKNLTRFRVTEKLFFMSLSLKSDKTKKLIVKRNHVRWSLKIIVWFLNQRLNCCFIIR